MTDHIKEARKLEPVAYLRKCRVIDNGGKEYESLRFSSEDQRGFAVVRLSDAQAALAAAEERGRGEERERFHEAIIPAYMGLLVLKTMCRKAKLIGGVAATESALSSLVSVTPPPALIWRGGKNSPSRPRTSPARNCCDHPPSSAFSC